jgi:hypothetical protein
MKDRLKIHLVWGFAAVALLLAQFGCSSKSSENSVTAGPSPTPDTATALPSPTPEETPIEESAPADVDSNTGAKPKAVASNTRAKSSRDVDSNDETDPAFNPRYKPRNEPAGAADAEPAPRAYNPPPPRVFTIPEGANITISTAQTLSTKLDRDGDRFTASLANPIVDGDWVIAKRGALVEGEIVNSDPGGKVEGRAVLKVKLRSLQLADGRKVALSTSSYTKEAKSTKKKDAAKVGIGAGLGAAIGAIAGGGKGAAIGAGAGVVLATRGDPAEIPSESLLTFRLQEPITVTKRP